MLPNVGIPGRARRAAIAGGAPPGFSLGGFSLKCCERISSALGNCCGVPVSLHTPTSMLTAAIYASLLLVCDLGCELLAQ